MQDGDDESEFVVPIPARHRTPELKYVLVVTTASLVIFLSGILLGVAIPENFKYSIWSKLSPRTSIRPAAQAWEDAGGSEMEEHNAITHGKKPRPSDATSMS